MGDAAEAFGQGHAGGNAMASGSMRGRWVKAWSCGLSGFGPVRMGGLIFPANTKERSGRRFLPEPLIYFFELVFAAKRVQTQKKQWWGKCVFLPDLSDASLRTPTETQVLNYSAA